MTPYFQYIKTIYPAMTAWKVGSLRRKAGAPAQYEKQKSKLHRDYSETVLDHPPREWPMSTIMVLDSFSFLVKPPLPSNEDEYIETWSREARRSFLRTSNCMPAALITRRGWYIVYFPMLSATRQTTRIPKYIPTHCGDKKRSPLHG